MSLSSHFFFGLSLSLYALLLRGRGAEGPRGHRNRASAGLRFLANQFQGSSRARGGGGTDRFEDVSTAGCQRKGGSKGGSNGRRAI